MDIALSLKTANFNKQDIKIIKEAYNQFLKGKVHKRISKRQNLRVPFLKYCSRKSGWTSEDQAKYSSLSSDDCRPVRSSKTKVFNDTASCRSTRTDLMDIRRSIKESGLYRDRTDDLRQNHFDHIPPIRPQSTQENLQSRLNNRSLMSQNGTLPQRGFLLPSQRFSANQSVALLPKPKLPHPQNFHGHITNGIQNKNTFNQNRVHVRAPSQETESDQEDIFMETKMTQKNKHIKQSMKTKTTKSKPTDKKSKNEGNNSFAFAEPQLPCSSDMCDVIANITTKKSGEISDTETDAEIFRSDKTRQKHSKKKQNHLKEKNMVPKNQITNEDVNNISTILRRESENADTNKKTDEANNCTKNWQNMQQNGNVNNVQSNNVTSLDDVNARIMRDLKIFWDCDYEATPVKKPEQSEKGLSNLNALKKSSCTQVNYTQKYNLRPRKQTEKKANLASIIDVAQAKNEVLADAPETNRNSAKAKSNLASTKQADVLSQSIQLLDDTAVTLEVIKKTMGVECQPNKDKNIEIIGPPNKETTLIGSTSKQNNTEMSKKTRTKLTKVTKSVNKESISPININTLRIRSKRTPKINKCCEDTVNNKQKPLKKKYITKSSNKESITKDTSNQSSNKESITIDTSNQSVIISSGTALAKKRPSKKISKLQNIQRHETKSRKSDVSFTLEEKTLKSTRRASKELRELQIGTPKFLTARRKPPLSKNVASPLNKSRKCAGLNKSKVN